MSAAETITPVVLCGGSGTRLWPRSRKSRPKPFLPLLSKATLFREALTRCADRAMFDAPIVVTGAPHLDHVEEQAADLDGLRVIVEPFGRNTAPAIALAAMRLPPEAVMLVCPSDHHIANPTAFIEAVSTGAAMAREGWLVAFGIHAHQPETGFGYIRRGEAVHGGFRIDRFVEKPDRELAQSFLDDGNYSWNGGLFAFQAGRFLEELQAHRPAMAEAVARSVAEGMEDGALFHPANARFAEVESDSVDYAVMENTTRAAMVPVDMGWSDIGNWQALRDLQGRDESGNVVRGPAELVDCNNVLVDTNGARVSVIGLEDVIIVVDGDDVLVTTAAGAQKVGTLRGAIGQ